jgi:hypothetical protein
MKLKTLAMWLVVAALASAALLANTAAATTSAHCARVAVVLKGTVAATPAKGSTQFALKVTATNRHGAAVMGDSLTITTNSHTKIIEGGKVTTLDALQANDHANVRLAVCAHDLPVTPSLIAATPAKRVTISAWHRAGH